MKTPSDSLYKLVISLSASEKKYFRRFSTRYDVANDNYNIELFDALAKLDASGTTYDENQLLGEIKSDKLKKDIHVYKKRLFEAILKSLRMHQMESNIFSQLYEQLEHAKILHKKGLLKEAYKETEQLVVKAQKYEATTILLEAIRLKTNLMQLLHAGQKNYWTDLYANMDLYHEGALGLSKLSFFFKISWRLHEYALSITDQLMEVDRQKLKTIAQPAFDLLPSSNFWGRWAQYNALMMYNITIENYKEGIEWSERIIELFDKNEVVKFTLFEDFVVVLFNYVFLLEKEKHNLKIKLVLKRLEEEVLNKNCGESEKIQLQLLYRNIIRQLHLAGDYQNIELDDISTDLFDKYKQIGGIRDLYIDCCYCLEYYFIIEDYAKVLKYAELLEQIPFAQKKHAHIVTARLLTIIAHIEFKNFVLISYLIDRTRYYLKKNDDKNKFCREVLNFLSEITIKKKEDFELLLNAIKGKEHNSNFLIILWIKSKIFKRKKLEIYQEKKQPLER